MRSWGPRRRRTRRCSTSGGSGRQRAAPYRGRCPGARSGGRGRTSRSSARRPQRCRQAAGEETPRSLRQGRRRAVSPSPALFEMSRPSCPEFICGVDEAGQPLPAGSSAAGERWQMGQYDIALRHVVERHARDLVQDLSPGLPVESGGDVAHCDGAPDGQGAGPAQQRPRAAATWEHNLEEELR